MGDVKLVLEADSFRLYHYDEDGNIVKKRGFKRISKGQEFTAPDYVADRLTSDASTIVSPFGHTRRAARRADEKTDDEVRPVNEQASQFPESDFGSTDVAGNLISDPEGKLQKQREEARTAERAPEKPQARQAQSQSAKKAES